jgi:hypothetical protein
MLLVCPKLGNLWTVLSFYIESGYTLETMEERWQIWKGEFRCCGSKSRVVKMFLSTDSSTLRPRRPPGYYDARRVRQCRPTRPRPQDVRRNGVEGRGGVGHHGLGDCRAGRVREARALFNAMPGWDMVSWTAMVQRYAMPSRNMVSWKASRFGSRMRRVNG